MKKKSNKIAFALFCVVAFHLFYRPAYSCFMANSDILALMLGYIYLAHEIILKKRNVNLYLVNKNILFIFTYVVVVLFYVSLISLRNYAGFDFLFRTWFDLIKVFLSSFFIYFLLRKSEKPTEYCFKVIIVISTIQGLVVLIELIFPELKSIINNSIMRLEFTKVGLSYGEAFRGYGLGTGHLFVLPVLQAFFSIVLVQYVINFKKYIFLGLLPLTLLPVILNARTGLFLFFIGVVIINIGIFKMRGLVNFILLAVCAFFVYNVIEFVLTSYLLQNEMAMYSNWMSAGFSIPIEILGFQVFIPKTFLVLLDYLYFPKGIDLLIGTGENLFNYSSKYGVRSDIGYCRIIFSGGIIYLILLLYYYFKLLVISINKKNIKFLGTIFVLILISNFKGSSITQTPLLIFIFSISTAVKLSDLKSSTSCISGVMKPY